MARFAAIALGGLLILGPALVQAEERPQQPAGSFGALIQLEVPTPLAEVVAHPERYAGTPILIRGRVSDVCQRKGCWTVLTDGSALLRIQFKDYGFFLPKDIRGRDALAEGEVRVEMLSQAAARHFAEESQDGDPESIVGPQRVVAFTASGVRLIDSDR
ncbi:MAG: DUF4920 domain-containing protein [bacterium]|nr:DUF4920 domain-containing protein [bacterium]MCP5070493.1 DUF4920 domain-containing protein [bacterium]